MNLNDQMDLFIIFSWTATTLAVIVTLLILYFVIRIAVVHALRSHHRWVQQHH